MHELKTCIYECTIWHARTKPRHHRFQHRHFMFMIDLDELKNLSFHSRLFRLDGWGLYRFDQRDHLPDNALGLGLKDRVIAVLNSRGITQEIHSIQLLTNVRTVGYVFNPVSFFFCRNEKNELVCCLVEVGNTFGEKKAYLVRPDSNGNFVDCQSKDFYVSPFTELDHKFDFHIQVPSQQLKIEINTLENSQFIIRSSIQGKRLEFTDKNLLKLTARYPLAPLQVILFIHLHAFALWLKGIPFHRKEENPQKQTAVMRPHKSIRKVS